MELAQGWCEQPLMRAGRSRPTARARLYPATNAPGTSRVADTAQAAYLRPSKDGQDGPKNDQPDAVVGSETATGGGTRRGGGGAGRARDKKARKRESTGDPLAPKKERARSDQ